MPANLTTKLGQLVDVLTPDTTNTRIGVANASPTRTLDVTGTFGASGASTLGGALTYGGITLSNAVTGTGNMVLSASPVLTGLLKINNGSGNSPGGSLWIEDNNGITYSSTVENTPTSTIKNEAGGANRVVTFRLSARDSGGGLSNWNISSVASGSNLGSLTFQNGANERARIDSSGNLLVGTASSSDRLVVDGNNGIRVSGISTGNRALYIPSGDILFDNPSARSEVRNDGNSSSELRLSGRGFVTVYTGGSGLGTGSERARFDGNGNLCVGSSSAPSGLTSAISVHANALLNGAGPTNVANNGTITMACGSSRFAGFLSVACVNASNGSVRTSATYSVFIFDGDNTSIQQIHTANGSGGGSTFTVAYAATGFLITNTSGGDRNLMASLVGTIQA